MKFFDLHCDTSYEAFKQNEGLACNNLHIDLKRADNFDEYGQVFAVWSDSELSDEDCFKNFLEIHSYFHSKASLLSGRFRFFLSVEDARLLCGKLDRLDLLYGMGVRFLIPMWKGKNIIGGAFDTDLGLSNFGESVIKKCFEIGIIPDVSHSSEKSAGEIFAIAERYNKPVIASHSCSFAVYEHPRNLRDEQFKRIQQLGGVVGLSFCSYHLAGDDKKSNTSDILKHIEHYLNIGGKDILCIGADMDGAPMPAGISGIESIPLIYDKICQEFGNTIAQKIAWENAYNFINNNL